MDSLAFHTKIQIHVMSKSTVCCRTNKSGDTVTQMLQTLLPLHIFYDGATDTTCMSTVMLTRLKLIPVKIKLYIHTCHANGMGTESTNTY